MALAALAPILGSIIAPAAADAMGLGGSALLASSIGAGLGSFAATGNPLTGLESGALGFGLGGLMGGGFGGGATGAAGAASATPTAAIDPATFAATTGGYSGLQALPAGMASADAGLGSVSGMPLDATNAATAASLTGAPTIPDLSIQGPADNLATGTAGPVPFAGATSAASNPWSINSILKNSIPGIIGASLIPNSTGASSSTSTIQPLTGAGFKPYQTMQAQAAPASYVPGVSPEYYYFASGGNIPKLPTSSSVDGRGMNLLNRMAMHSAMPMLHGGGGGAGMSGASLLHPQAPQMGSHVPKPLGMDDGGAIPAMGADPSDPSDAQIPAMQVPDVAGDGSSDSIPATIDGKAPALLSSDEHVIPADAVAHIGNGSSSAGHRKLQAMTARVRMAKTGRRGMPPRINAQAMMPA